MPRRHLLPLAALLLLFAAAGPAAAAPDPAGVWLGSLQAGGATLRLRFDITGSAATGLAASMTSLDQSSSATPARIVVDGAEVRVRVPSISGVFAGTLSADGDTLAGRWTQLGQDLQVDPAQNLPAVEKALSGGRSPQWEVRELPGLNHLFQTATTGAMSEYGRSEETMAPAALEAVSAWITSTTGR